MQYCNRPRAPGTLAAVFAFAVFAVTVPGWAQAAAQNCGGDLAGARHIESAPYALAYRTRPAKIVVGKHFSVEFAVCAKADRPAPDAVQVDATMPAHHHGMNYQPTIEKTGPDHYRADGLMFHMPGRWDLTFELQTQGKTERLTRSIVVQ
jgi:hypothetical protein